tara:strand:+ start:55 stop:159 length:105 start_codon:yes stop_codon:yes gene_type:complete
MAKPPSVLVNDGGKMPLQEMYHIAEMIVILAVVE